MMVGGTRLIVGSVDKVGIFMAVWLVQCRYAGTGN